MIQYCSTTDTHTDDCSTTEHHKGFVGSLQIHVHLWLTGAAVEHQLGEVQHYLMLSSSDSSSHR